MRTRLFRLFPVLLILCMVYLPSSGLSLIGNSKDSKDYTGMDLRAIEKVKASFQAMQGEFVLISNRHPGLCTSFGRLRRDDGNSMG